jgi:PIN domain nuclease of toxin-antitoxin system
VKCLLDTCTFLWIIVGAKDLSPEARQIFANPANEVFLSAVSVWELSVKHALGKLPLPGTLDRFRLIALLWNNVSDMGSLRSR